MLRYRSFVFVAATAVIALALTSGCPTSGGGGGGAECAGAGDCTARPCQIAACIDGGCDYTGACDADHCLGDACLDCIGDDECDDGDPCTTDACRDAACFHDAVLACQTVPDCTGDADCDDGDNCTDNSCINERCEVRFNRAECDDGDACTERDVCQGGACAGTPVECDTAQTCVDGGCVSAPKTTTVARVLDNSTDIGIIATEDGGDKLAIFGEKDTSGNLMQVRGTTYIDSDGRSLTMWFGPAGLPEIAVTGNGWVVAFSNHTGRAVDLTVTRADGTTTFHPGVAINPSAAARLLEFAQDGIVGSGANVRALSRQIRPPTTLSEWLEVGGLVNSWIGCGGNILQILAGGSGIPSAITGCSGALLSTYASVTGNEAAAAAAATLSIVSCGVGGATSCLVSLGVTAAADIVEDAEQHYSTVCRSQDRKRCFFGNIYWFDSCGGRQSRFARCTSDAPNCVEVGPTDAECMMGCIENDDCPDTPYVGRYAEEGVHGPLFARGLCVGGRCVVSDCIDKARQFSCGASRCGESQDFCGNQQSCNRFADGSCGPGFTCHYNDNDNSRNCVECGRIGEPCCGGYGGSCVEGGCLDFRCVEDPCPSHSNWKCFDDDVYWYNRCGPREELREDCTGDTPHCDNNSYQCVECTSNSHCGAGGRCQGGSCVDGSTCTPNSYKQCWSGDVYWYDSCGNREAVFDNCLSGEACSNGACIPGCDESTSATCNSCYGTDTPTAGGCVPYSGPSEGMASISDERIGTAPCGAYSWESGYIQVGTFQSISPGDGETYTYYHCVGYNSSPWKVAQSFLHDANSTCGSECPGGDVEGDVIHRRGYFWDTQTGHLIKLCVYHGNSVEEDTFVSKTSFSTNCPDSSYESNGSATTLNGCITHCVQKTTN